MKIYFAASLSGKNKHKESYESIVNSLKDLGHKLISDHVLKTDYESVKNASDRELVKYYKKTLHNISDSDLIVAEVSHPTIGIGHEISLAMEKGKPAIVLYEEGVPIPQILKAVPSGNVKTYKYTLENINQILSSAVKDMKGTLPIRFNFFIQSEINDYLDWISKAKRIPRAVYLRNLLEKEMAKNKEYHVQDNNI